MVGSSLDCRAVGGPAVRPRGQLAIAFGGLSQGLVPNYGYDGVESGTQALEPIEAVTGEIYGRDLTTAQHTRSRPL